MDTALQTLIDAAKEHHRARRLPQAQALYRQALQQSPENPDVLFLMGILASEAQRDDLAIKFTDRSIRARPSVAAGNNLARLLMAAGKQKAAIDALNQAIDLNARHLERHESRVAAASMLGRLEASLDDFAKSAAAEAGLGGSLAHDHVIALNALGNTARALDMRAKAVEHYRGALALEPDLAAIWHNLALTYSDRGDIAEALACYDKALALAPDLVQARSARALAHILPFMDRAETLTPLREAFARECEALDHWFDDARAEQGYQVVGESYPFYLAYQEADNRALLQQHGALCCRLMKVWQDRRGYRLKPAMRTGRVRLGIVSPNIRNHSVWHALLKGWLRHLDPATVEIHLISTSGIEDADTDWAKAQVASFANVGQDLDAAVRTLLGLDLDVLIYPAVGMERLCIQLASLRLCPVQMVSWGHPETTGLPTVDYYLSAEDLEPDGAQNYYCEKLVALPHLGCCYQPLPDTSADPDLAALGLSDASPLLISPGVPFKYAPQFDVVYPAIARRLGDCQIVFFTGPVAELSEKFRARLRAAFEREGVDFDRHCRFIRWLDQPEFYGLMKTADVFLDTLGFSGFNTAIQAIECGLPVVTRDGRFLRGRLASGILRRLEMTDLIAADAAAYVDLAVKLVQDTEYAKEARRRIVEGRARLFNDVEPVAALQRLLVEVTERREVPPPRPRLGEG